MPIKNTTSQYGSVAKFFHWTVAIFVIVLIIVGFLMDDIGDKAIKMQVYNVHKLVGLTVLSLMTLRLIWRWINDVPSLPARTPKWERIAARSVHNLLYLALILMPLSGWIMSSAAGHPPVLAGWLMQLPGLALDKELAHFFNKVHSFIAWSIIGLVVLHLGAALKHHFIDKNDVLRRMLPWTKPKPSRTGQE